MIETLVALVKMQHLDDIITQKEILKKRLPLQLQELESNVSSAKSAVDEIKKNVEKNIKSRDKLELDVNSNNESIAKFESQLALIKTNKEYKALNEEIAYVKEKNAGIDDKLIELMDEEQELKNILAEKKDILAQAEKELKDKENDLRKKIVEAEHDIEKTREKRNEIAKTMPLTIVKRYATLIQHKNRKAIVFPNSNSGCGGCGFSIRPQLLIDINKKAEIVSCESCGRMIVSKDFFEDESEKEK